MKPILKAAIAVICLLLPTAVAAGAGGLIEKQSAHGVKETVDRFEAILKKKGITVFARIDHAAGAAKIGQNLAPTELIIFGSPKMGTPLMTASRRIGIDLPLKLLAWQDGDGKVRIAYHAPDRLKARYQVEGRDGVFAKMAKVLDGLTAAAVK